MKLGLEKAKLAAAHSADFFPPFMLCYNPNSTLVTQNQKVQLRMRLLFFAVVVITSFIEMTSFFLISSFRSSSMLVSPYRKFFLVSAFEAEPACVSKLLLRFYIIQLHHFIILKRETQY